MKRPGCCINACPMETPEARSSASDGQLADLKLRALAEFAAGAGHEINKPVATIVGHAQQLLAGETDPDRRHALATISAQAYRIRDMIGDVMLFARPPRPHPSDVELPDVLREISAKFDDELQKLSLRIEIEASSEIPIYADPVQLRIVVSSLLRNSIEAIAGAGTIVIRAWAGSKNDRRAALFSISDSGPGLSAADREHLFDPFYSGRQAGRGLGFGLAKAWRIVTLHGGTIEVASPAGKGLTVTVCWPALAAADLAQEEDEH